MGDDLHEMVAREIVDYLGEQSVARVAEILRETYVGGLSEERSRNARLETLREAASASCMWCGGKPILPTSLPVAAARSSSGSWWHHDIKSGAFAGCMAGEIHNLISGVAKAIVHGAIASAELAKFVAGHEPGDGRRELEELSDEIPE